MEVRVDAGRCVGAGNCALMSPDVFDQRDEDGLVILLADLVSPEQEPAVRRAAAACPAAVIELVGHEAPAAGGA